MPDLVIKELAPELHDDLMHFFDFAAYADNPHWAKCFCAHPLSKTNEEYESRTKEQNRTLRSAVIRSGKGNGLVAYRLGRVAAWCHAASRSEVPMLASWDAAAASDTKTGAIVCFVVAPDARREGIAGKLLDAACGYLTRKGATAVEGYPPSRGTDDPVKWPARNYHGPLSMYLKAGFREVSRNEWVITVRKDL